MVSVELAGFGIVVILAFLVALLFKALKLPTIVGYLVSGIMLYGFGSLTGFKADLVFLPQIGIAFLLFLVGMELDVRRLADVGKTVILASVGQMVFTSLFVIILSRVWGVSLVEGFYLGLALSFSSTVIVVKLFLDRQELDSLHGRLALGILLIEDLVAVVMLMVLSLSDSSLGWGLTHNLPLISLLVKSVALGLFVWLFGKFVISSLLRFVASNMELLVISAVAICFLFVEIFIWAGFSLEIGAFLAGVVLGTSDFRSQIASRVKPIRDLFVAVFFIQLGEVLGKSLGGTNLWIVFTLVVYALFIKPLFFLLVLTAQGFKRHSAFHTSIGLSQVSEFSLIVMSLAFQRGQVGESFLSAVALTAVFTMAVSSFTITHSGSLYRWLKSLLELLPQSPGVKEGDTVGRQEWGDHVVLVGCDRSGSRVMSYFKQAHIDYVAVDFNPEIYEKLKKAGVRVVFGDISDDEVGEKVGLSRARLVISTVRDTEDSLAILKSIQRWGGKAKVILSANSPAEAKLLERRGADKVIVPLSLEGEYIVSLLKGGLLRNLRTL